jgi:hypothetical protein
MWEPFLWLALLVAGIRWVMRRGWLRRAAGPLPDVADAPRDAEPIVRPLLEDNGLVTYAMVFPGDPDDTAPLTGD